MCILFVSALTWPFIIIGMFLLWFAYLDIKEGSNNYEGSKFTLKELLFMVAVFALFIIGGWYNYLVPLFDRKFWIILYLVPFISIWIIYLAIKKTKI